MKVICHQLLISSFIVLLPIYASQVLEYRLWKNNGQVIYDYSGNNLHGWNGDLTIQDSGDCLFTDRGAYLSSSCRVSMHSFLFTNPISISIWAISDNSISSGRIFCKWSSTRQLQVFRDRLLSKVTGYYQGLDSMSPFYGDSDKWHASNY